MFTESEIPTRSMTPVNMGELNVRSSTTTVVSGVLAGVVALIVIISAAAFFILRRKDLSNSSASMQLENGATETLNHTGSVTQTNPLWELRRDSDTDDPFRSDFEEYGELGGLFDNV